MALLMVRCFLPVGKIFCSQIRDSYMRVSHSSQFPTSFFMFLDWSDSPDELLKYGIHAGVHAVRWGELFPGMASFSQYTSSGIDTLLHLFLLISTPVEEQFSAGEHDRARMFHWEWNISVIVPSWILCTTLQNKLFSCYMKQPVPTTCLHK